MFEMGWPDVPSTLRRGKEGREGKDRVWWKETNRSLRAMENSSVAFRNNHLEDAQQPTTPRLFLVSLREGWTSMLFGFTSWRRTH